jgi:hypothetical protein
VLARSAEVMSAQPPVRRLRIKKQSLGWAPEVEPFVAMRTANTHQQCPGQWYTL